MYGVRWGKILRYHQGITYHYLHRQSFSAPWSFHLPVRYIFGRYLDKGAGKKVKQSKHGAFICPVLRLNQHVVSVLKSMKAWITTNNGGRITADFDNRWKPDTDFCAKSFLNSDFSYCFFFEPMIQ